jgi:hypothetical protein
MPLPAAGARNNNPPRPDVTLDNLHDLPRLDLAFRAGDLEQMLQVQDLALGRIGTRHVVGDERRAGGGVEPFFEVLPDDVLRLEKEDLPSIGEAT